MRIARRSGYRAPPGAAVHAALLLRSLGEVARAEGRRDDARSLLRESLTTMLDVGEQLEAHWVLDACAHLDADVGRVHRAVRLAGAAQLREAVGAASWPVVQRQRSRWLASARATLGEAEFVATWAAGEALTRERAIAFALEEGGRV